MNRAIEAADLHCRESGKSLLQGVSLSVSRGDRVVICGPSGSGKTTLLRALAGLQQLEKGRLDLRGRAASLDGQVFLAPHERGLSMLFQDLALWPSLSVRANLSMAYPSHVPKAARRERVDAFLTEFGLLRHAKRFPSSLSGGEQQRLALARVLLAEPSILLLDEPFTGLDLGLKRHVIRLLDTVRNPRELTIVAVTHDPYEAALLGAKSAFVMDEGQLIEEIPLLVSKHVKPVTETAIAWLAALSLRT